MSRDTRPDWSTRDRAPGGNNDPDRLERRLLEISPADAPLIRSFCRDLSRFINALLAGLPVFRLFWRAAAPQTHTFADKFQHALLSSYWKTLRRSNRWSTGRRSVGSPTLCDASGSGAIRASGVHAAQQGSYAAAGSGVNVWKSSCK